MTRRNRLWEPDRIIVVTAVLCGIIAVALIVLLVFAHLHHMV